MLKGKVQRTNRPEVLGDLGGFAGLFKLDMTKYKEPVLASSTDGVGTKLVIAQTLGIHDTVGIDLVAMVVDDLVVCGAEPLFLTDYIACGRLVPDRVATIVGGVAEGCRQAGCALIGGETAEHPGLLDADEYDLAGAGTGVVEEDAVLGPARVRVGDTVIAMASSGLHANGYSLVRHVLLARAGWSLDRHVAELGRGLGEELLTPTRIYATDCLALAGSSDIGTHAFAHVTGGGLAANLDRVLPDGLGARIDRGSWSPPPIFDLVGSVGAVERAELERTLNMGVGMVAVVDEAHADRAIALLADRGVTAWAAGVITDSGAAELVGSHP
jgi:phosphoribosylformylglycinamidine cyclo-ligase